jgi:Ca-activated chloride channel homolog
MKSCIRHTGRVILLVVSIAVSFVVAAGFVFAQQQPAPPPASAGQSQSPPPQTTQPPSQQQAPAPPQKEIPTIRTTVSLVHLVATVMDRRHNFVTDLEKSDFKVLEDGTPQEITSFGRETDLPLRIGLLLDTSNSIRPRLNFEQDAAIDFLSGVLRRNKDMAFLMTFDNEPEIVQDFTTDVSVLTDAIRRQRAGGGTALHDAIFKAADKIANPPLPKGPNSEVRRVLVVISDGDDNLSDHALSDAIEAAIHAEAAIYSISTNTDWISLSGSAPRKMHLEPGDKVLEQFALQSGGRVFYPYKVEDLAQSFVDIGTELRSQYFIAYAPSNSQTNGRYRKIDVETDRKGLTVRTRKGYYATSAPARAGDK